MPGLFCLELQLSGPVVMALDTPEAGIGLHRLVNKLANIYGPFQKAMRWIAARRDGIGRVEARGTCGYRSCASREVEPRRRALYGLRYAPVTSRESNRALEGSSTDRTTYWRPNLLLPTLYQCVSFLSRHYR